MKKRSLNGTKWLLLEKSEDLSTTCTVTFDLLEVENFDIFVVYE